MTDTLDDRAEGRVCEHSVFEVDFYEMMPKCDACGMGYLQVIAALRADRDRLAEVNARQLHGLKRLQHDKEMLIASSRKIGNRWLRGLLKKRKNQIRGLVSDLRAARISLRSSNGESTDLLSRPSRFEPGRSDHLRANACPHGRRHRCIDCLAADVAEHKRHELRWRDRTREAHAEIDRLKALVVDEHVKHEAEVETLRADAERWRQLQRLADRRDLTEEAARGEKIDG